MIGSSEMYGVVGSWSGGTGIGMSIAANKVAGVRAALVADAETAVNTRQHNNSNVLCLGERVVGPGLAESILESFLATGFEGGRHEGRVRKIEIDSADG